MTKKSKSKKVCHESLTIKQAQHKNCAEEAHLGVVCKFIHQEKLRCAEDIERARKQIRRRLDNTLQTTAVPGRALVRFHENNKSRTKDVCMHIVHCYLGQQETNKERWHQLQSERGAKMVPPQRPVTTPDHLRFIHKAFPDTLDASVALDWQYNPKHVNIYEHGRAGHDMKCMSTRAKPVGGYATRGPINFRFAKNLPEFAPFMDTVEPLPFIVQKPERAKRKRRRTKRGEVDLSECAIDTRQGIGSMGTDSIMTNRSTSLPKTVDLHLDLGLGVGDPKIPGGSRPHSDQKQTVLHLPDINEV